MKTKIVFILLVAFIFIAFAGCSLPAASGRHLGAASLAMRVTPAPPAEDQSEIGSTDGIFVMGIVIVLITAVPILSRRKKK
ncbi:MAG: hypothetical protein PHQ36_03630 [Anaerolineales bacterium]|nr:hypothetical protein [Anaerolineales bacterium]